MRIYFVPDFYLEEVLLDRDIGRVEKAEKQGIGAIQVLHTRFRCGIDSTGRSSNG